MVESCQQRCRRIRTNRPVEGAPIVQRIGQRPHAADTRRFRPDGQRQDSHGPPIHADQQHAQPLPGAEMPPIDIQPVERLEEGGIAGLRQERIPEQAMAGQRLNAIDLFDLNHGMLAEW